MIRDMRKESVNENDNIKKENIITPKSCSTENIASVIFVISLLIPSLFFISIFPQQYHNSLAYNLNRHSLMEFFLQHANRHF